MARAELLQRRPCETFPLRHGNIDYVVSVGNFHDGNPAEVFVSGPKAGSGVEAVARDAAIILSLALQFGVPADRIKHAITRNERGEPSSVMGALIDRIAV